MYPRWVLHLIDAAIVFFHYRYNIFCGYHSSSFLLFNNINLMPFTPLPCDFFISFITTYFFHRVRRNFCLLRKSDLLIFLSTNNFHNLLYDTAIAISPTPTPYHLYIVFILCLHTSLWSFS